MRREIESFITRSCELRGVQDSLGNLTYSEMSSAGIACARPLIHDKSWLIINSHTNKLQLIAQLDIHILRSAILAALYQHHFN